MRGKQIVSKVDSSKRPFLDRNEELVFWNPSSLNAYRGESLFDKVLSFMGKSDIEYFVVSFDQLQRVDNVLSKLVNPATGHYIELSTSLHCHAANGKSELLVKFAAEAEDLYTSIQDSVRDAIEDFTMRNPEVVENFLEKESELKDHIMVMSERYGFTVKDIGFRSRKSREFQEHISRTYKQIFEIKDDSIEVENKIVMNLVSERQFNWSSIDNVEEWVGTVLQQIIQNELINLTYKEVILNFEDEYRPKIREELEKRIKRTGYSIMQIISVPSEEIALFMRGFTFKTNEDDLKDNNWQEEFSTAQRDFPARLQVILEGAGRSVKGVEERLLKPGVSLVSEVKKVAIQIIARHIQEIDPEKFFLGDKRKVEIELREVLEKGLQKQCNTRVTRVNLNVLPTAPIVRYKHLISHRGKFKITEFTGAANFEIKYRVIGISDYNTFSNNQSNYGRDYGPKDIDSPVTDTREYQEISELLKHEIERKLNQGRGFSIDEIKSGLIEEFIEKEVTQLSIGKVTELFGLNVGKISFARNIAIGLGETLGENVNIQDRFDSKKDHLLFLIERKNRLTSELDEVKELGEADEIKSIESKLEEVNKEFNELTKSSAGILRSSDKKQIESGEGNSDQRVI